MESLFISPRHVFTWPCLYHPVSYYEIGWLAGTHMIILCQQSFNYSAIAYPLVSTQWYQIWYEMLSIQNISKMSTEPHFQRAWSMTRLTRGHIVYKWSIIPQIKAWRRKVFQAIPTTYQFPTQCFHRYNYQLLLWANSHKFPIAGSFDVA